MLVRKRDGRVVLWDDLLIATAIQKAVKETKCDVDENIPALLAVEVRKSFDPEWETVDVEMIQDAVVEALRKAGLHDVARKYTAYRNRRTRIRRNKSDLIREIGKKVMAADVSNQNANVDEHSFGGRRGEAADALLKQYALDNCMSEMARTRHVNNEIYIHDLNSYAVGMHNCASRDTKFITDKGVYSFEDFSDGDRVVVLTHLGNWKNAVVRCYGKQRLNSITFSRAGQRFTKERFTPNHRWVLYDEKTGQTHVSDSLKIGDRIAKAPSRPVFDFDLASPTEKYYWCLGFVLADGTEACRWSHGVKHEDIKFVRLRLCGDKTKYASRFDGIQHSVRELDNGDLYLTFSSLIGFRKVFPDIQKMAISEKAALFDGIYCADGSHTRSIISIMTADEQMASFIEDIAPSLGYYIISEKDLGGEKTNYGVRSFSKEYKFTGDANKYYWTVIDIQPDDVEDVWCLEVEDDHSFVLPNGIVTGNCISIPFDDLLANGFKTRQTDVRPANSINTAFQLVAVIFQLQSLCQFGGCSATHLDWTMVPYVRKSFYKHYVDGVRYCGGHHDFQMTFDPDARIDSESYPHGAGYIYAMDMTKRELKQAVEGMYHNLNTLQSRAGDQLPFTSINYGTCTLPEGRMVIRALLEGSLNGVGAKHLTPVFPCGIFQMMRGVNRQPGDPNYDLYRLALESTAKRLYPNYANVDWSGNVGYDPKDPKTYFATINKPVA